MVDFKQLRKDKRQTVPTDPLAIFQRLPKPAHINDLWDGQSKALAAWSLRRGESDLVIKLNTGGGKTLVGLLMAQSLLNELSEPLLYLCPNNQLVDQTIEKADEVGLPVVAYGGRDLDADFLNAKRVLVANYHAVFNGLSKFGVLGSGREPIRLGGVICDDAHAALGVVRAAFTISIKREEHAALYDDLVGRCRSDFENVGRVGTFDDIVEREDFGILELPYPAWLSKANEVRELIARDYAEQFRFQWPLLRDHFHLCHALFSAREITITPFQPLVHLFPSFAECRRRIFMSATIADDSSIVRTFDANPKSVSDPIVPSSLAGVGERMVLAPSLMELKDTPVEVAKRLATLVASKLGGSVILVQSEAQGKRWEDMASLALGDDVAQAVKDLRAGASKGPYVFASRYDGIDLPHGACRLLILEGLPSATNNYELFRAEVLRGNSSINLGLAQRIEQALGRGTRGSGDYCVVLLLGGDLTAWITRKASLSLMTPSTRAQVQLGYEISKALGNEDDFLRTVMQCFKRDKDWVTYHAETLAESSEKPVVDARAIDVANRERIYLAASLASDWASAIRVVRELAETGSLDKHLRGWLLQLAARAAFRSAQETLAMELQRQAFSANGLLVPPATKPQYEPLTAVGAQVGNILDEVVSFALRKGIIDEFECTIAMLTPGATANQFEDALKRFGELLGFRAQRPEHQFRHGPDVLWLADSEIGFVIECKHRKDPKNLLTKEDHGQFLTSMQWAHDNYHSRKFAGFIIHPSPGATVSAAASSTYVLTLARLGELVSNARQFYHQLCASTAEGATLEMECSKLLGKLGLRPQDIAPKYLAQFATASGTTNPRAQFDTPQKR